MGRWEEHGTGSQKPRAQCKEATAFVGEPRHSFRSLGAFAEDLHADPVPGKGEGKRSQPGQCQELVAQRGRDHVGILLTHEVGAGPGGKAEGGGCGGMETGETADQVRRVSQVQTEHGRRPAGGARGDVLGVSFGKRASNQAGVGLECPVGGFSSARRSH